MSLSYVIRQVGDVAVLDLGGRVSLSETLSPGGGGMLHEVVRNTVKTGSRKILINLREAIYIDSSGLGELVSSNTTVHSMGGNMKVCSASPRITDLLMMTSLHLVLEVHADEAAALCAFGQRGQIGSAA